MIFTSYLSNLEAREALLSSRTGGDDTQNIEADSLGERSALANDDGVTFVATEAGRDMGSNVGVALLVTLVFLDVMEVISADDDGSVHFGGVDLAGQDSTTDGNITSEGALLVDVVALNGFLGGSETETDRLVPSVATLTGLLAALFGDLLVSVDSKWKKLLVKRGSG